MNITEKFNLKRLFMHNVLCRRSSNQHKALKLWLQISKNIDPKRKSEFAVEWNHYVNNSLSIEDFVIVVDKILKEI